MSSSRWTVASVRACVVLLVLVATAVLGAGEAYGQTFTDPRFSTEVLFRLEPFEPNGLGFSPDGRLFVWQRSGLVWVYKNGALQPDPFIDIRANINPTLDDGLLGLTFDPDFALNGYVYLLYTHISGGSRLTRVTSNPANPDRALPASEVVIFGAIPAGFAHVIGTVRTASDGTLFVGVGDLASFNFAGPFALRAQDLYEVPGKILRIHTDGSPAIDNPFYDGTDSIRSRVWAYGLRNPFRFSLHPLTGEPYIADVGWNEWEEINRGRGANFGWPCYEGPGPMPYFKDAFALCQQLPPSAVTPPLYTYRHTSAGGAATGNTFYTGTQYPPEFRDNFFFGDYVFGTLTRLIFDAALNLVSVEPFATGFDGPVGLEMGPDGLLYYVNINTGEIGRIRFSGATARASGTPTSGYSPLTVSFSSAGSADPNGMPLTYFWDFGDGTTSTAPNPVHTYISASVATFTARLTVTDVVGVSASATVRITVGSLPPIATISTPVNGTGVFVGDTIAFQGSAVDPDQGVLPPAALSWQVLLHHNDHIHPFGTATGSSGSFTVINHETNAAFSYEVVLNATDASGLVGTARALLPFNPQGLTYVVGLSVDPATVAGGGPANGTVTLSKAAPAGGITIALASNRASAQVPATVTVPAGGTIGTFTVATAAVSATDTATISATFNGTVSTALTITPPPSVTALTFVPNLVKGGISTSATLRLTGPAAGGGMAVGLTSSQSAVQVPAIVTVPGGSSSVTFAVTTSVGTTEVVATVTATLKGTVHYLLTVSPVASGAAMRYADRAALLADGWDFIAVTSSGDSRDTEQTTGRVVSYDQAAHPGTLRIPADAGDLWGGENNTRNTLFRNLPANWTSIRMKVTAFAPTANTQTVCLAAYEHDDRYVVACRDFASGQIFEAWHETGGAPSTLQKIAGTATTNMLLRLDRDAAETIRAFFSIDGGTPWTPLGNGVVKALASPRLGVFVGANNSTTNFPPADIEYVEILTPAPAPPTLSVAPAGVSLSGIVGGANPSTKTVNVTNAGGGSLTWSASADQPWVTLSPSSGSAPGVITIGAVTTGLGAGTRTATITITSPQAGNSPRTVGVSLLLTPPPGP